MNCEHLSPLRYYIFDAFTTTQFKGNPAAVVFLPRSHRITDTFLQSIASEFNLAETAFVTPSDSESGLYNLRWFTPTTEFPLCGHATLSSAAALFLEQTTLSELSFSTLSGVLHARQLASSPQISESMKLELELPAGDVTALSENENEHVTNAVGQAFFASAAKVKFAGTGSGVSFHHYLLIEIKGVPLEGFQIDVSLLNILRPRWEVIIFTQLADNQHYSNSTFRPHFISRVFCPLEVVPEDPVTGSAHCMLGPYWATRLDLRSEVDSSETELRGVQVSARSGNVGVLWDENRKICRIRGYVTLVAKGELYVTCTS